MFLTHHALLSLFSLLILNLENESAVITPISWIRPRILNKNQNIIDFNLFNTQIIPEFIPADLIFHKCSGSILAEDVSLKQIL